MTDGDWQIDCNYFEDNDQSKQDSIQLIHPDQRVDYVTRIKNRNSKHLIVIAFTIFQSVSNEMLDRLKLTFESVYQNF